jgi:hypothetical protein
MFYYVFSQNHMVFKRQSSFLIQIYLNRENSIRSPAIPDGSIWLGSWIIADDYLSAAVASGPRGERNRRENLAMNISPAPLLSSFLNIRLNSRTILR